jgi:S-DNA-T family DNA segregation ATPase FtsK/SpoIIIE
MFEDRSLKLDLCALALLSLVAFLGVSLWTYEATDPPGTVVWPATEVIQNACGRSGALAAHYLLECLGIGAYYLTGSLAVVTFLLLVRRDIDQPMLRTAGWVVSVVGLTTLAALVMPNWTPGPVVGAGGYVGAMGRSLLEAHFAQTGAYIFAISVLLAGLLLSTDYFMFRAAAVTTSVTGRTLMQVGHLGHVSGKKRPARVKSDLEDEDLDEEESDEEYDAEDDDEEYEEDETDEEEELEEEDDEREIRVRTPNDELDDEDEASGVANDSTTNVAAVETASAGSRLANGLKAALGITNRRQQPAMQPPPPPPKTERQEVIEQLEAADQQPLDPESQYELPPVDLLLANEDVCYEEHEKEVRGKAKILEKTFKNFGFNVRVVEIETGPVIAQYEVELEAGLRLSKITGLADDLAIALRVPSVRIVAPIPGKNTVGIEVPNENRQLVRLREVIEETNGRAKRMKIPVYLGKDVAGNPMVVDLAALPHLLIAGRTGTGKSVCLNSIIVSILMTRGPDEVRMLMIDPKMVELNGYRKLPHLMHPVVTDMRKAEAILAWAVDKMEERYQLLSRAGVRHVSVYNQLGDDELRDRIRPETDDEWRQIPRQLPYIVIVADEMADLMLTAGKDVEQHIIRLAQKSRAVGIHLILATQKPTVDVITGLIKSNLPARIAFQVASRTDSRVVLDEMGAEKLLGNGDMLFLLPGTSTLLRGQGTYLSDDEITRVVDCVGTDDPQFAGELMQLKTKDELEAGGGGNYQSRDELYETAVDIVLRERRGSVSLLQRALGIGYGRAARLIDFMAEDGVVGQYNGAQARDVLISLEEWEARHRETENGTPAGSTPNFTTVAAARVSAGDVDNSARRRPETMTAGSPAPPRRRNKITPDPDEPSDLDDESLEEEYDDEELDNDGEATSVAGEDGDDDEDYDYEAAEDEELEEDDSDEAGDDSDWDDEEEADDELEDDEEWDEEDEEVAGDEELDEEDDGEVETDEDEEPEVQEERVPRPAISRIGRRQLARRPGRK